MNNIYLIGMMGAGKTTVGVELHKELKRELIDVDHFIVEENKMSINEMFSKYGEKYFRDVETKALKEISERNNIIVSCGGGIIVKKENVEIMRSTGTVFYIKREIKDILDSINTSQRPLLKEGKEKVLAIFEVRKEIYEQSAHVVILNNSSIQKIVKEILEYDNKR